MTPPMQARPIEDLPHTPASDLKKIGWRGVMIKVNDNGKVVVSNHNTPQAVILSVAEYQAMRDALIQASERNQPSLDLLRESFDQRLKSLNRADAGERLRDLMKRPAALKGKVKAAVAKR